MATNPGASRFEVRESRRSMRVLPCSGRHLAYDRGGYSSENVVELKRKGVKEVGLAPQGQARWAVAEKQKEQLVRDSSTHRRRNRDAEEQKVRVQSPESALGRDDGRLWSAGGAWLQPEQAGARSGGAEGDGGGRMKGIGRVRAPEPETQPKSTATAGEPNGRRPAGGALKLPDKHQLAEGAVVAPSDSVASPRPPQGGVTDDVASTPRAMPQGGAGGRLHRVAFRGDETVYFPPIPRATPPDADDGRRLSRRSDHAPLSTISGERRGRRRSGDLPDS